MLLGNNVFLENTIEVNGVNYNNLNPSNEFVVTNFNNGKIGIKNGSLGNNNNFYITDQNFHYLMQYGNFEHTSYQETCVIVKDKKYKLIPITSPFYDELLLRNERKDIRLTIGQAYQLSTPSDNTFLEDMIYLGKAYFVENDVYSIHNMISYGLHSYKYYIFVSSDTKNIAKFYSRDSFILESKGSFFHDYKNKDYVYSLFFEAFVNHDIPIMISFKKDFSLSKKEEKTLKKAFRICYE